jgi:hypothetical protein
MTAARADDRLASIKRDTFLAVPAFGARGIAATSTPLMS